ncbi:MULTISPECIES: GntR family transcriptional regulator [Pseudomonas]|uniref:GntR family transcriptional regulator n=1 Tax=Pseudomonas TaxID=286 RepID=UPI000CFAEA05|nr:MULTISPECIES: GntR family transcriptional regulator [Pseudomonas]PQZ87658.1 GntR family transcriptional regulator [Pseudomonas trivialis]PRB23592.1 GntR family transcriptional regulator [Pseudomonas sp. MYb60]
MAISKFPVVANERSRTLGDQVADSIVSAAIHGHLAPGARLIEVELAEAFGVSRVPVREALKTLESQGIVVTTNREICLIDVDRESLEQMLSVRVILETHAVELAMSAIAKDKRLLEPFEDALHNLQGAIRKGSAFLAAQADMDFHRAIYLASGNRTLVDIWDRMSRKILIAVGLRVPNIKVYEDHERLLEILKTYDLVQFKKALVPHVLEGVNADSSLKLEEITA